MRSLVAACMWPDWELNPQPCVWGWCSNQLEYLARAAHPLGFWALYWRSWMNVMWNCCIEDLRWAFIFSLDVFLNVQKRPSLLVDDVIQPVDPHPYWLSQKVHWEEIRINSVKRSLFSSSFTSDADHIFIFCKAKTHIWKKLSSFQYWPSCSPCVCGTVSRSVITQWWVHLLGRNCIAVSSRFYYVPVNLNI